LIVGLGEGLAVAIVGGLRWPVGASEDTAYGPRLSIIVGATEAAILGGLEGSILVFVVAVRLGASVGLLFGSLVCSIVGKIGIGKLLAVAAGSVDGEANGPAVAANDGN
jgi:hypothetical protein